MSGPKGSNGPKPTRLRVVKDTDTDEPSVIIGPRDFMRNTKGGILPNTHNRMVALQTSLAGVFAYDSFEATYVYIKPPPWPSDRTAGDQVTEACYTRLTGWMDRELGLSCKRYDWVDAVAACARHISSLAQAIDLLPEWDGVKRVDSWLIDYAHAEDTEATRIISRMFYLGFAMRILSPGSTIQTVLILEGPQGIYKSRLCKAIASPLGPKRFGELKEISGKDAFIKLRGKVLLEIPELSAFRGRETEHLKAYLSTDVDIYRPLYGKLDLFYPRSCVFVGTTNERAYLHDTTGNRRYMPVRLVGKIDIEAFQDDAKQLLAEALYRVRQEEQYYCDSSMEAVLAPSTADRIEEDPLKAPTLYNLRRKSEVCVSEILSELGLKASDSPAARRIAKILVDEGWEKKHTRLGNIWERPS